MLKLSFIAILLLLGCAERDKHGKLLDTPTSGTITVAVDESLRPLIDAEIAAFEGIYTKAHITVIYTSEGEAIDTLLKDSARCAIVARRLGDDEIKMLTDQKIKPMQRTVAIGGVALIVNKQNPDTLIQLEDLKKILSGETKNWNVLTKGNRGVGIEVVFDRPNSGIIHYLKDSLDAFNNLPENFFAVNGNKEVVEYISLNPQALGLIDVSWISDSDDSTSNTFLDTIRVMGISTDSGFYQPYQAYIAQGDYPLSREVILISREARTGLASGFLSFMASDKGQRIVLKSGLVPATMPVRIIEVNHEPL
ncbi:MAG: phosphate ABC transporter substrate-binding protein [Marivirga sp.]|nr:phosphate ABC transporter substrate-binding protein [Marivirga sp.]